MQLFVGLGNPGVQYARNRHNIGFMAVDRIAADHGFAPFRVKFQGEMSEGRLGADRVVLLKPTTFMNNSGQAVGEAMRFYKLDPSDITVFHDEIDLAPGKVRLKAGGGHAGHNGLRSIHQHIGPHYDRVRLGVGHPGHKDAVAGYVLHDFSKADEGWLDDLLRGIGDGAAALADGDGNRFLNAIALRVAPPRSSTGGRKAASEPDGRKAASEPDGRKAASEPDGRKAASVAEDRNAPAPQPKTSAPEADRRSPLQKLADRFR